MKIKKCRICKETFTPMSSLMVVCSPECAYEYQKQQRAKKAEKERLKKVRETRLKKKELRSRAQWYSKLQSLVNQFVLIRDKSEPCCTCGKQKDGIKYDAGHCFTVKARPDIRFDLRNIHKQCSVNCNQHGSGMRHEYKQFIINKYGQSEWDRLSREGQSLKAQFPTWQDIEKEINRYRSLIRELGHKPRS